MTKHLYDFKVNDEVWHISEPGRYGFISMLSLFDNTIWVKWTELSTIEYTSGLRPKILPKACQPCSYGAMRHTHRKL